MPWVFIAVRLSRHAGSLASTTEHFGNDKDQNSATQSSTEKKIEDGKTDRTEYWGKVSYHKVNNMSICRTYLLFAVTVCPSATKSI